MKKFKEYKLKVFVHLDEEDEALLEEARLLYQREMDCEMDFTAFMNMIVQVGLLSSLREKAYDMLCDRSKKT